MDIQDIVARLQKVRARAGGYIACCPAHDDQHQSLSIAEKGGKILVHCHAGCTQAAVIAALKQRGAWPDKQSRKERVIEAIYDYVDADGNLRFQVVRYTPKDFRQRKPDGTGGWIWRVTPQDRVLYNLPEVLQRATTGGTVIVVEGEKDVETARRLGLVATCNAGGAGKWQNNYTESLRGAKVIIVPDNDEPGHKHATMVSKRLRDAGIDVSIVELPGLPPHGDFTDWVSRYSNPDDAVRDFLALCEQAPRANTAALVDLGPAPLSDVANALRFLRDHRGEVYHSKHVGWLVWDGARFDASQQAAESRAMNTARNIFNEINVAPYELRPALEKWAQRSHSNERILALLSRASALDEICRDFGDFDSDSMLLNVQNGVVDLETGKLLPHSPSRLMTHIANVTYDSDATCPTLIGFLHWAFDSDLDCISYLQRCIGYTLTGLTREQVLFFCWGEGFNGKSIFLGTIEYMLGTYARTISANSLMQRQASQIPNDIARLAGARAVFSNETSAGKRFDDALLKELTGCDRITARFLHREFFDFRPKFKLWLRGNHRPRVSGDDKAIWRRMRLIPWLQSIPAHERDDTLEEKFHAELPGILNWAIEGCIEYQKRGLGNAPAVTEATETYRADMSDRGRVREFLAECCYCDNVHVETSGSTIYGAYRQWCEARGHKPINHVWFGRRLAEEGYEPTHTRNGSIYTIAIKARP